MKKSKSMLLRFGLGAVIGLLATLTVSASAPTGELPYTGDHSRLGLVAAVMGAALVIILVVVFSSRRKNK